jgi:hypothetical protein
MVSSVSNMNYSQEFENQNVWSPYVVRLIEMLMDILMMIC